MLLALFADGAVSPPVVPDGVWMAVVSMLGVGMGYLFKWLGDRDKLRYDAKILTQDAQIATQNTQIATLTAGHAKCQEDSQKLEQKVGDLERRLEAKAEALATQDRLDKRDLEAKIESKLSAG